MDNHWFWWIVSIACVIWYSTVTVYVAIRGVSDIKSMLRRLSEIGDGNSDSNRKSNTSR